MWKPSVNAISSRAGEQVRLRRRQREGVEERHFLLRAHARGSGGSARWSSCRGAASAPRRPASSGMIATASALPSSTPHWSKESIPQIAPWVKTLCS